MQPKKPLHEYTVAGLLFVAANTQDAAVKTAILNELRNRRQIAISCKEAAEQNRIEKEKLNIELEIEGVRSKCKQARRKANRDLFAEMKDRAFEIVDIPEGLSPTDAVKRYNKDIHAKAKELYITYKQENKKKVIKERRTSVEKERKTYRKSQIVRRRLKSIETAAYQNARFPLIGAAVYYTDTTCDIKKTGTIRGFTYDRNLCTFVIRIEVVEGGIVKRALSAIEPVENPGRFNDVRSSYMEFEDKERIVKERDALRLKIEIYQTRLSELDLTVNEYMNSEFRRNWFAADEIAKAFARDATGSETDIFQ